MGRYEDADEGDGMKNLLIKIIISALLLFAVVLSSNALADKNEIYMIKISDAIGPGMASRSLTVRKPPKPTAAVAAVDLRKNCRR